VACELSVLRSILTDFQREYVRGVLSTARISLALAADAAISCSVVVLGEYAPRPCRPY
jgi:hypothetical protein